MKKIVHRIKQRKLTTLSAVLLAILISIGTYTFLGINENVKEMSAQAQETVYYFPEYPKINSAGKDPTLLQRGEYLAKAGDCIACHTNSPEKGIPFAGGLPMKTPFGTIYSPNITPDKETGMGNWTEAQFIKAMREGVSPQGHYYFPAFPYYYFNHVTDEDLKAIKAYLDSIPPIKQKNRPTEMIKPFDQRFLQFGWRFLFFRGDNTGPFKPDPKQSDVWNRGAYLVEGLGHCAMCHSPSYHLISQSIPLGAPIHKYNYTGSKIQGYLAPNISKSNLQNVSIDEIVQVFTEDKLIGGGKVEGPMLEVNRDSLRHLTRSDLEAIATYLKTVVSETPPIAKSGTPGKPVYESYCSGCHVSGAGGAPKYGDPAAWDLLLKNGIESLYTNAIHGKGSMPAKGTCLSCSEDDVKQAVDYMLASVKSGGGKAPTGPAKEKPLTLEDGKRIYDTNCAVCHDVKFKNAPKPGDVPAWQNAVKQGFLETYLNVEIGRKGHPLRGACSECSDAELKAAVKWMMQQSAPTRNYNLW